MNSITTQQIEDPYKVQPIVDNTGRNRCLAVVGPNITPAYFGDFKRTDAEVHASILNQAFNAGREFELSRIKPATPVKAAQKATTKAKATVKVAAKTTARKTAARKKS